MKVIGLVLSILSLKDTQKKISVSTDKFGSGVQDRIMVRGRGLGGTSLRVALETF